MGNHDPKGHRSVSQRLLCYLHRSALVDFLISLATFASGDRLALTFSSKACVARGQEDGVNNRNYSSALSSDLHIRKDWFDQAFPEHHFILTQVLEDDERRVDFLAQLPVELANKILSYCNAHTLLTLTLVSRRWSWFSRDNALWRQLYRKDFSDSSAYSAETSVTSPLSLPLDYLSIYRRRTMVSQRWRKDKPSRRYSRGHSDSIYCVQFDGNKMVTGSRDRTIKWWDMQGRCTNTLVGHHASVLCLQFDQEILVSGSSDHSIIVWSMHTGQVVRRLNGHTSGVLDVSFDAKTIASCSKDGTIRLWDRASGAGRKTLLGHRGSVNAIQLKAGKLVSASGDSTVKLWDVETGECIRSFVGHTRGLACIQFDGQYIVSGSNDNKIKVWNADTGECTLTCTGHTALVRALHFDKHKIVSGSYDQSIRVWDIRTGECLRVFENCHSGWVYDVTFDETKIISTSQDRKILIMDFAHGIDTQHLYS